MQAPPWVVNWWPVVAGGAAVFWLLLRLAIKEAVHSAMADYRTEKECSVIRAESDKEVERLQASVEKQAERLGEVAQKAQIILSRRELGMLRSEGAD